MVKVLKARFVFLGGFFRLTTVRRQAVFFTRFYESSAAEMCSPCLLHDVSAGCQTLETCGEISDAPFYDITGVFDGEACDMNVCARVGVGLFFSIHVNVGFQSDGVTFPTPPLELPLLVRTEKSFIKTLTTP